LRDLKSKIGLTLDFWTSSGGDSYLGLTAHFKKTRILTKLIFYYQILLKIFSFSFIFQFFYFYICMSANEKENTKITLELLYFP
jgi:hypothetical protein